MDTFTAKIDEQNKDRWSKVVFKPSAQKTASSVAKRLVAAKDRYVKIEKATGVPWYCIAVIHEREASQRWDRNIAQGDRFDRVSVNVPKGRGPFNSFEDAAYDALVNCPPHAAKWTDWSQGGTLTILELYNGVGYEKYHNMASPYIWAGTNQYTRGKYVQDGKFDAMAIDQQLGCAVLLEEMAKLDASVPFGENEVTAPAPEKPPEVQKLPEVNHEEGKAGPASEQTDTVSNKKNGIIATLIAVVTSLGGAVTDWKVLAVLAAAGLAGFALWVYMGKPRIKDMFK